MLNNNINIIIINNSNINMYTLLLFHYGSKGLSPLF